MKHWFKMTKSGVKREDYREITPYWCNRFLLVDGKPKSKFWWEMFLDPIEVDDFYSFFKSCGVTFKPFFINTMTLGYPKKGNHERTLNYIHEGIEIREGNEEWGAEKGKLYFVVKHGQELLVK